MAISSGQNGVAGLKRKDSTSKTSTEQPYKKPKGSPSTKPEQPSPNSASTQKPKTGKEIYSAKSSQEAHAHQRALAKERKALKPNADNIARAKKLWESLRRKSHVVKAERDELVSELFSLITGQVRDFVFKHDAVRVIQCALKYANAEQRKTIARELKGEFRTLAESRYGKFLVAKLIVEGDEEVKDMVMDEFYGHVRRLINHPEASWILDDTYRQVASPTQKALLLREWYGPEYSIFRNSGRPTNDSHQDGSENEEITADLATILTVNPEKRKPTLENLHALINQLVQKKMTAFTMLHDAMLQYSLAVGSPQDSPAAAEFTELLKSDLDADKDADGTTPGDLLKNLAFTPSGSRVLTRALSFATAKDRKAILRIFKDHVDTLAFDPNGASVLVAAFEVVDDTKLTTTLTHPRLLSTKAAAPASSSPSSDNEAAKFDAISTTAADLTARIPLLYPLAADKARWLFPKSSPLPSRVAEMRALRTHTSKKDPTVRRRELARALLAADDGVLFRAVEARAAELAASGFGCQFVTEVLLGYGEEGGELGAKPDGAARAAVEAVAALAAGDPTGEGHVARSSHAGRMLSTLVAGVRFGKAQRGEEDGGVGQAVQKTENGLRFGAAVWPHIETHVVDWAVGASSFVVVNLLEEGSGLDDKEKEAVRAALRKDRERVRKAAREGDGSKGAGMLLEML